MKNQKYLTDEQQELSAHVMLEAAYLSFGELPTDPPIEDVGHIARMVVRAMCAAEKASESERIRYNAAKAAEFTSVNCDAQDVVATAFWLRMNHIDLPLNQVAPACVIGSQYLGFASGMAAAKAMSDAAYIFSDAAMFEFSADGAVLLSELIPKDDEK